MGQEMDSGLNNKGEETHCYQGNIICADNC